MALTALRGAIGFLTRLPVGTDEAAWAALRRTPAAIVLAGYVVGALVAVPLVLAPTPETAAAGYVAAVVLLTGGHHADGLADVGDAAMVHGSPADRRRAMRDTAVGVGGVLALGVTLLALALGALALAQVPQRLPGGRTVEIIAVVGTTVVVAEVAAKLAVAVLVCTGAASHEGTGGDFVAATDRRDLRPTVIAAGPAALLPVVVLAASAVALPGVAAVTGPTASPAAVATAAVVPLVAGVAVALLVRRWADARLGGVGGDVFGATNELARVAALHAGVMAWTLW